MQTNLLVTSTVLLLALGACDIDEADVEPTAEVVTERAFIDNGYRLNGYRLNGSRINGYRLNGYRLNGADPASDYIEITSFKLPGGETAGESWLSQGSLRAKDGQGNVLGDTQLIDAKFTFKVMEGGVASTRDVWIKSVEYRHPGYWLYDFDLRVNGGAWAPLCTDAVGARTRAVLLNEVWDPATGSRVSPTPAGAVTIACQTGALAKCIEFGYIPWRTSSDTHQACTRMVRADYCGNGQPHTVDGTLVHVIDTYGIQTRDTSKTWVVEAEWSPAGSSCLNPKNTRLAGQAPSCSRPACGMDFQSGGSIQSGKVL
jgi:hypothetical protein